MGERARFIGFLFLFFAFAAVAGCARPGARPPRYAAVLGADGDAPADLRGKLHPPSGACLAAAKEYMNGETSLVEAPLPAAQREGVEELLDGLPSIAQRVLARMEGIWLMHRMEGVAGVTLTCAMDLEAARGGFVLIDLDQLPLDRPVRDTDVPALYWQLVGDAPPGSGGETPRSVSPRDHAARYYVLHEIGHALSLFTGEFALDGAHRIEVRDLGGFAGLSWDLVTLERHAQPPSGRRSASRVILPRREIGPMAWGNLLDALGADADTLVPGYALARSLLPAAARARGVCEAALRLPRAGFVTPTAARYPTEDYAEMFAHAMLAAEGKIRPTDRIRVELSGCGGAPRVVEIAAPYFSAPVAPKRAYIETALGLGA